MPSDSFVFGPFVLDTGSFRLSRDGVPIRLQPKVLEMLVLLVRSAGALVTREELRDALWPDVVVSEHSLRQVVLKLREALAEHEACIETVPRKGLRFVAPLSAVRVALPAERDGFVGRDDDLARLGAALDDGGSLLSVVGPGGVGKTRLVVHHAWAHHQAWPGGAWFCDLSDTRTANGIAQAVAVTLGVGLGREDPIEQVGHAIARRGRCLLILDNFEQVVDHAAATLGRWLDAGVTAQFLVTTRQRLGLAGEQLWRLAPLGQADAERLFVRRARMARPDGPPLDDDPTIESLVATLDRLPLAIELAAARCALMSPRGILDRLTDRFAVLAGPRGDRQGTLRATLDWSWDLLAPAERTALAQLSVFEGGFTVEAAEGVLDPGAGAPPTFELLQGLVDKSLVRPAVGERLELLVSVQEYARGKLRDEGSSSEVRHGRWFATHPGELDNLLAACRRAVARGDGEIAAATALAAGEILRIRGPFQVWADWLELAATVPGPWVARLRIAAGRAREAAGQFDLARAHLDAGLSLARAAGDRQAEARAELGLGVVDRAQGRVDAARERITSALEQSREVGDSAAVCEALRVLGLVEREQGRIEAALARTLEALAEVRRTGNHGEEGMVLSNLGIVYMETDRLDEASSCFDAALRAHRQSGHRNWEGAVLTNLGILRRGQARYAEAEACAVAALAIQREVGDRRGEAGGLGNLGIAYANLGRMAECRAHFQAALALYRELGSRRQVGLHLGNLATVSALQGRWEEAERWAEEALVAVREVKDPLGIATALSCLGSAHQHHGRTEEARALYLESLDCQRRSGSAAEQAECLVGLASLAADGDWEALADEAVAVAAPNPETAEGVTVERALLRARAGRLDEARADLPPAASRGAWSPLATCRIVCTAALVHALTGDRELARSALAEAEVLATTLELEPVSQLGARIAEARAILAREESGGRR